MSLDWTATDVRDWTSLVGSNKPENERTPEQMKQWHITETLIFGTMLVGINKITAENADTFFARYQVYKAAAGITTADLRWAPDDENPNGREYNITAEDVARRAGLRTNASPHTDAAFAKEVTRWMKQAAKDRAYWREREAKEAKTKKSA